SPSRVRGGFLTQSVRSTILVKAASKSAPSKAHAKGRTVSGEKLSASPDSAYSQTKSTTDRHYRLIHRQGTSAQGTENMNRADGQPYDKPLFETVDGSRPCQGTLYEYRQGSNFPRDKYGLNIRIRG